MGVTKSDEYLTNQKCYITDRANGDPNPCGVRAFAKIPVLGYICRGHAPYALVAGMDYEILKEPTEQMKTMWKANGILED